MQNLAFAFLAIFVISSTAQADQKATITCLGDNVVLTQKIPYLGENSAFEQELFRLHAVGVVPGAVDTAYFLDIDYDIGGAQHCFGAGSLIISGQNHVNGSFQLCLSNWQDRSDGTTTYQTASGTITYSHGPLNGTDESVTCVME